MHVPYAERVIQTRTLSSHSYEVGKADVTERIKFVYFVANRNNKQHKKS